MIDTPSVLWSGVVVACSIAFFNFFGLSVTRHVSATARSLTDTCRTLAIWIVSLGLGWEKLLFPISLLQIVGFGLLVYVPTEGRLQFTYTIDFFQIWHRTSVPSLPFELHIDLSASAVPLQRPREHATLPARAAHSGGRGRPGGGGRPSGRDRRASCGSRAERIRCRPRGAPRALDLAACCSPRGLTDKRRSRITWSAYVHSLPTAQRPRSDLRALPTDVPLTLRSSFRVWRRPAYVERVRMAVGLPSSSISIIRLEDVWTPSRL